MTRTYRQKLLNWFYTMSLLLVVQVAALALAWRTMMIYAQIIGDDYGIDKYAGPMGEALLPYIMFFVPLALWHLFDFLESEQRPDRWRGLFSRYRHFAILLLLSSPFAALGVVEGYILRPCDLPPYEPGQFAFVHCDRETFTEIVFTLIITPLVGFALVSKALAAILSHVGRAHVGEVREDDAFASR